MVYGLPVLNVPVFVLRNFDGFRWFFEGAKEQIKNFDICHISDGSEIAMPITFRAIWIKAKSLGSSFLEVVNY